jgi:hypothetical protein
MLKHQRLFMQLRFPVNAPVPPGRNKAEVLVIAQGLAIRCLVLDAEVSAAGFIPLKRVQGE